MSISQPLDEHGAWAEKDYNPLESEFMERLKGIEGTSCHEVQESEFIYLLMLLMLECLFDDCCSFLVHASMYMSDTLVFLKSPLKNCR